MFTIILFFLGILCCSLGLMFCILYLNLLTIGYSFSNIVHFIISKVECQLLLIGVFLLLIAWKGHDLHELLLRYRSKL